MSLFDFPRINFHGIAQLSPGTANNDDYAVWMQLSYMPRTRDLSDSRRTLLRAWCRKIIQQAAG